VVVLGITRELGPVIAGLMIAGRVAAAIAAEIGTMKVTEQIDALTTLATNRSSIWWRRASWRGDLHAHPHPDRRQHRRVRGYVVSVYSLGFTGSVYLKNTVDFAIATTSLGPDQGGGVRLHRGAVGCYNGFNSRAGRRRGQRHHLCVVSSSILILAPTMS